MPPDIALRQYIEIQVLTFKPSGKMQSYDILTIPWDEEKYFPWKDTSNEAFLKLVKEWSYGFSPEDTVVIVGHPKYDDQEWYNRCYTRKLQ